MQLRIRTTAGPLLRWCPAVVVATTLSIVYSQTLAPGLSWANQSADGGDLITAAAVGGVAHPPGYPTYLLLVRVFHVLPVGDLAFRSNVFSAWCAVCTALLVVRMVETLAGKTNWPTSVSAMLAAVAFGASPLFWSQAVVTEVYTLNTLFAATLLHWSIKHSGTGGLVVGWSGRVEGLLAGVALGNHLTVGVLVVVWLVASGWAAERPVRVHVLVQRGAWVGVGLLVYLVLPLRAMGHPPVNWGNPSTGEGFWWLVSGQLYRDFALGLPASALVGRVLAWASLLVAQFGVVGVLAGFVGLLYGGPSEIHRRWGVLSTASMVVVSFFAITYRTGDSDVYLLPVYLIFAVWVGQGLRWVMGRVGAWRAAATPVITLVVAGALLWPIPRTWAQVDASSHHDATGYVEAVLAAAPPNTLVLVASDYEIFALWYAHYACGRRSDIVVVAEPLLPYRWYRDTLREVYPSLRVPPPGAGRWDVRLADWNPTLPICYSNRMERTVCKVRR